MKIKSIFLVVIVMCFITATRAQNHLDYSYTLDALYYSIPGYESEEFFFKAHLYPVFHSHNNDSVLSDLNGLFAEELSLPKSATLKERMVAVKIDNLMSDRQVLEMLMARAGMLNENPEQLNYLLDVRTDRIDFPDNRETVFNYRYKRETSTRPDQTQEEKRFEVIDWSSGALIHAGEFGNKKLMKCIQDATKNIDYKADNCEEETSLERWKDDLNCETVLGSISEEEISFFLYSNDRQCESSNSFPIEIEVLKDCFENDKPCE